LRELVNTNLKTVKAYLLKEYFQAFWGYSGPVWAGKFLDTWITMALRSRIEPMQKVAKMLRRQGPLILNWFEAKGAISNGVVGRVITKRAYGFRTYKCLEVVLYHELGHLPVPVFTHRFW
jgi:transposase